MKQVILLLLLVVPSFMSAQNNDLGIKFIQENCKEVRKNITSYDMTMVMLLGESAEGGRATAYYDKSDLKMIKVEWFGESGKRILDYYFHNGILILAFNQNFNYNRPIYWNREKAEEMRDGEVFDPDKTTVKEDRYYFESNMLFLWLNDEGKEVELTNENIKNTGQELIRHSNAMKEKLRK